MNITIKKIEIIGTFLFVSITFGTVVPTTSIVVQKVESANLMGFSKTLVTGWANWVALFTVDSADLNKNRHIELDSCKK